MLDGSSKIASVVKYFYSTMLYNKYTYTRKLLNIYIYNTHLKQSIKYTTERFSSGSGSVITGCTSRTIQDDNKKTIS